MDFSLVLLVISWYFISLSSQKQLCRTFFTLQPPNNLPCDPYLLNATVSLQCKVSAPIMSTTLQELNFTVIWLKLSNTEGAKEQIIYGSDFSRQNAVRVTQKRYHRNKGRNYELVVSVTSTLFLRFHKEENVAGRYWCRVLAKDLDDYSFKNEGESTITYIKEKEFYDRNGTFYPPCESDEVLHNTGLQCINRRTPKHDLASTSFRNSVYKDVLDVSMSKLLVVLLVLGGILTVLVVITSLPTANLSKVMCKRTTKRIQQVTHGRHLTSHEFKWLTKY